MSATETSISPRGGSRPTIEITARGPVPHRQREYAARKLASVTAFTRQPVRSVHAVMEISADPGRQRPSIIEATLDVDGTPVRAHVSAELMHEAVDLLEDKLRRQLVQLQDRTRTRHRWTRVVGDHEWRHGFEPSSRTDFYPRPPAERKVVRRKTFALDRMTPDEAAFDMELLGHTFYLFTDATTGEDAVMHQLEPGRYVREGTAHLLTESQAIERLDVGGEPFVFFRESAKAPAMVLYRRYDGHYGVITAA